MKILYPIFILLYFLIFVFPSIEVPQGVFPQGDEIMHIRTVRESIEKNSLLIPQLTGLANAYKPPALFWAGIASDLFLGISYTSERIVSLFFGLFTTLLLYFGVLNFGKSTRYAFTISLAYASTFAAWKFSRLLMMEQMLTFFLLLFVYLYLRFQKEKKPIYLTLAIISLNISYFIKGPLIVFYALLLPVSFLAVDFLRIRKKRFYINWKSFLKYTHILLFPLSFVIPIMWMYFISQYSKEGSLLIKFFLFNENLGKFFSENQSILRIFGGWLLYLLPFTPMLFFFIFYASKSKIFSKEKRIFRVIAYFLLALTLLHLLPNRKDSYYVAPFIPIFFLGLSLAFSENKFRSYFEQFWISLVYILIFISIALIAFLNSEWQLLIITGILSTYLVCSLFFRFRFENQFIFSILFMPIIAFFVLPTFQNPLPAQDIKALHLSKLCVVSENPWHAMDYQNQLQKTIVVYTPPSSAIEICEKQGLPILSLSNFYSPNKEYVNLNSWYIWKAHLEVKFTDVLEIIQNMRNLKFKEQIHFYEVSEQ
ncbi:MAG: phospholipid carrier-dependent glycosyltransferase [Leptospira sp.]|nr:phospholipid carrier-dependent glycosyltransferase [Leptospira sp.]